MTLHDSLASLLNGDGREPTFLLVDHSGLPDLATRVQGTGLPWRTLFGAADSETRAAAPWLIRWPPGPATPAHERFAGWLCHEAAFTHTLSVLASPLDIDALALRLQARLDARTSDGQDLLFRFADTRILASALAIFSPGEHAAFLGVASGWWYCNRQGVLQNAQARFHGEDHWPSPWRLTDAQFAAFLKASEPDEVLTLLAGDPQLEGLPPEQRHAFVAQQLRRAETWGLSASADLALYCALALSLGTGFDTAPAWAQPLGRVKAGALSLQQAVEQVDG